MIRIQLLIGVILACGYLHALGEAGPAAKPDLSYGFSDNVSLVIAESPVSQHVADPQTLACYHFVNGQFTQREEILTTPNKEVRFDLGGNHVFSNRYAITRWGDVVGLEEHAIFHNARGEQLVTREDNSLILYRSNDRTFSTYDLLSKQHKRLDNPGKWGLLTLSVGSGLSEAGALSPDGTKAVVEGVAEMDVKTKRLTGVGGTLTLCTLDGKRRKLGERFLNEQARISSSSGKVPVLWLDNERVLTQKSNGKLVILKMDGSVEPVVDIQIPDLPLGPASLSRDPEGRIIYRCVESYVIDVEKKQSARVDWVKRGYGFETEPDKWPAAELAIRYRDEEIGRGSFDGKTAKTCAGYLAVAPSRQPEDGSPLQLHVWNARTQTWFVLPLGGHLLEVIGWAESVPK